MSYDAEVIHRARAKLEQRCYQRNCELEQRRAQIALKVPEVMELDQEMRLTGRKISDAISDRENHKEKLDAVRERNTAIQARQAELLQAAGFSRDALKYQPFCPMCNDQGDINGVMCTCLKKLCAEEQIAELSKLLNLGDQSFETFSLDYYPDTPGQNGNPSPRDTMKVVLQVCQTFARQFPPRSEKNLYLYGAPGLGKTFLSACIARTVSELGYSVVYDTASNIFRAFEQQKFSKDLGDLQDARDETKRYLNCDLLIFDDLGTELVTSFVQSSLYELINTRMISNKHTIISSNLSPMELEARYTRQISSRINGTYRAVPFIGEDIRRLSQKKTTPGINNF